MRILFIGDIFGRPGRHLVSEWLPQLIRERSLDLVVANAENAAAGFGLTPAIVSELLGLGIDVLTTGNHVWDKRELIDFFQQSEQNFNENARRVLRPANYPAGTPGWGVLESRTRRGVPYAVINLQGRVFMAANDDPFRVADELLRTIEARVILIDFHAEATSEKVAFGWYMDGRVTAVAGTHTHIPTCDERILPKGTGYITDVGMTGPYESVIGVEKELALHRFLTGMPARFEPAKGDPRLCAVVVECDQESGRATSIERLMLRAREHLHPHKQPC
ncbi:MAG: TIGR00282 family metallophosphoesterase [Acidobacteria bacterium]|nr:TIGR00282 family metallophosphoesterase [Acidobacteriota bacterium]